ncbi:MAG: heavy metal translocating P-type ATPase [Clostridiaceae bacterium]|nr:heavy metal translocating P-type ATPase [Clostridiaceae bacterium]
MTRTMTRQRFYNIENLGCPNCAAKMEKQIKGLNGVQQADLDFATARLRLEIDPEVSEPELTEQIQTIIHSLEQDACLVTGKLEDPPAGRTAGRTAPAAAVGAARQRPAWLQNMPWRRIGRFALGLLPLAAALIVSHRGQSGLILYLAAYLILGYDVLWKAVSHINKKQFFDENFLMSLATLGAFAVGQYPEGVAVMLFYQIGEIFQNMAVNHSRRSIQSLMAIKPDLAILLSDEGPEPVDPSQVKPGDRLLIRPGDRVPVDCRILDGQSSLDTAALTGESMPRPVETGDDLLAGCVNGSGLLTVEALRPAAESAVSRVLELVEKAAARKAPAEQFITRFSAVYTPIMVGLAVLLAVIPPLVLRQPFSSWIYQALILLVISCPCALVLSVPLGYFAGLGAASKQGILIKGGQYLDQLANVRSMAWDKTGTLTQGAFTVSQIESRLPGREKELLEIAALAESFSTHPIARSVQQAWEKNDGSAPEKNRIKDYRDQAGRGVYAVIDGREVLLGNMRLLSEAGVSRPAGAEVNQAGTWLYMAIDGQYAGSLCLEDQLKPEAAAALSELKSLGVERHLLLSGDRTANVAGAAAAAGIDAYKAELLPEQKVEAIEALMEKSSAKQRVAYVGDGINDAPVLARVDLGIALGGGSDAALERADVVMISADLKKIPAAIRLARRTNRIVRQNIVLALGIKSVILILAVFGLGGIWQAVFADVGVALLAVLNSLRVLRPGMRNRLS